MYRRVATVLFTIFCTSVSTLAQDNVLTLVTHDSFSVSEEVLSQFEAETGIQIEILRSGDAGLMVNQAILSRGNPLGDVLFGIDNTFLSRALENDIFIPYESPALKNVAEIFIVDKEHRVTPIDYGDVCLNYDVRYFEENDLELPQSLSDLTDETYRDLLVVEDPSTSSPGLAFLMATIGVFGTEGNYSYLDFWADLTANGVLIVDGWENAYYGEFSGSTGSTGTRPLVVSYASSPPVEVYFMEAPPEQAPTGAITADETCFRQIEFAGILSGTDQVEEAQLFIDFMLSVPFQEDLPLQMFVFPVNPEAELPEIFTDYVTVPESSISLPPDEIDANREAWIQAWAEVALR